MAWWVEHREGQGPSGVKGLWVGLALVCAEAARKVGGLVAVGGSCAVMVGARCCLGVLKGGGVRACAWRGNDDHSVGVLGGVEVPQGGYWDPGPCEGGEGDGQSWVCHAAPAYTMQPV